MALRAAVLALLAAFVQLAASESTYVTCGSTIKLEHVATKHKLHSHQVAYSRGSQQQSVTGYPTGDDANSYWAVKGTADKPCTLGEPIKKNTKIRLQHGPTRKWLHSHQYQSPLSGNQEISCFGDDNQTDGGDVWTIEWDGKAKFWRQEQKVRFKHTDTGVYMISHEAKFGQPIGGQQEICGIGRKVREADWVASEGVYYPRSDLSEKEKHEEL